MFRDLKEYQEIAKIYTDKVSKPEDLEERVRGGGMPSAPKIEPATPPQKGFGGGVGNRTNRRGSGARNNRIKPEKKMSNIPVIDGPVNNPEYGQNMSRDEKDLNPKPEIKKPDPKPVKKMHPIEKKNRLRMGDAKVDALKAKNTDFKAMRKGTMSKDDFIKKYPKSMTAQKAKGLRDHTEWEPYDYVLEYLLSSEQAATIEEANYVMTEMDAETIQGIVEEQKKTLDEMDMMKMPVVNVLGGLAGAVGGTVAAAKYLGRKAGERSIKKEGEKSGKPGLIQKIKTATDAKNKAIKGM